MSRPDRGPRPEVRRLLPVSGCAPSCAPPSCGAVTETDPRKYRRYKVQIPLELAVGGRVEVTDTEDIGQGGCKLVALFPLRRGELVRVRLRSPHYPSEPSGAATVAWATRDPPYRAGLQFSQALNEQMPAFLRALLGSVPLLTREG